MPRIPTEHDRQKMPVSKVKPKTRFQLHVERWGKGCGSDQCPPQAKSVCLMRGTVPCDVLFCAEAPGLCVAGGTLIDTAFRDRSVYPDGVPIRDLVGRSGVKVYSYDVKQRRLVVGSVNRVWKTGYKKVCKVSYFWWGGREDGSGGRQRYVKDVFVTPDHKFLLKDGTYRSVSGGLEVGNRLQPFYRNYEDKKRSKVGTYSGSMQREAVLLLEEKIGRTLEQGEQCHHDDRNPENDSWDNLMLLDIAEHARLHGLEDNAMFNPVHRETHRRAMESEEYRRGQSEKMKEILKDPVVYAARRKQIRDTREARSATVRNKFATDPCYYFRYLSGKRFRDGNGYTEDQLEERFKRKFPDEPYPPSENHKVFAIEERGMMPVYDMEVEKYHNFAANGIFLHNCENGMGLPLVGPAGHLLDRVLARSLLPSVRWAMTNVVGCIPRKPTDGDGPAVEKDNKPSDEQVHCCMQRLQEFVAIARPQLIVCVGTFARDWLDVKYHRHIRLPLRKDGTPIPQVWVDHPAKILRSPLAQQGLAQQRMAVIVANAVEEFIVPF